MKTVRKVSAGLLALATLGLVVPAFAIQFDTSVVVERVDQSGSTGTFLGPLSKFCYLGRVRVEDTDGTEEAAECRLIRNANGWTLSANLSRDGDASVRCEAFCYTTN